MASTVLVTGANRGLGLEFVKQLAQRGDHVIATTRTTTGLPADLIAAAREIVPLEASDPASVAALAARLKGRPIDMLVNNAGVSAEDRSFDSLSFEAFERVFRVNTFAPALLTSALAPNLRAGVGKKVLNISSTLGSIAYAAQAFSYAYCASKAALNMISARMAKDLKADSIIVVSFCPGWNKTDMGGPDAPLEARDSIRSLLAVADRLTIQDSGRFLSHEGQPIAF